MRRSLVVLSNRQPYQHDHSGSATSIETSRPVSGVISALEPVVRQHQGVWIAQASGNADFEVLNPSGEIRLPPQSPHYRLRRVFLTDNERQGHTDGFSNRTLWPLCHISYQKPEFHPRNWNLYQTVNQHFANAVRKEELTSESTILIQDFQLALVPGALRTRLENQGIPQGASKPPKIGIFWHIPWPPAEIFLRCPWSHSLMNGILGADWVGFHTRQYCDNFLSTCEIALGTPIDRTQGIIHFQNRMIRVRNLPVSIEPEDFHPLPWENRSSFWKKKLGIESRKILLAVDRVDHTKGILERLQAYMHLLQMEPKLRDQVTLVQVAPPSRSALSEYRNLQREILRRVHSINESNQAAVVLISQPQNWQELSALYQMADVCVASPVHDGMNLVAKEYVWCQHHAQGALVLSQFAGAYHELGHASWCVNPYDQEGFAETLALALEASPSERETRMRRLRSSLFQRTATQWGNELLHELETSC